MTVSLRTSGNASLNTFKDEEQCYMKRYIKASSSSRKAVGDTWSEFIQNIEDVFGYKVDGAYRRRPEQFILMYDESSTCYEAEVTKYFRGPYELLSYNIHVKQTGDMDDIYSAAFLKKPPKT